MIHDDLTLVLLGIFLILSGVAFLVFNYLKKKRCTDYVIAEIVAIDRRVFKARYGKCFYYAPVYRYYYNGETYQVSSNESSGNIKYKVGDTTEIFVNPSNPQEMYDLEINSIKVISAVLIFFGVCFLLIGIFS